jgi:hypothetical protein
VIVKAVFDPLETGIHLRLKALAPKVVAAQGIDLLAHADKLMGVIGLAALKAL